MIYPKVGLTMLSYFDLRMLMAAFLIDVPNRVGGILTISSCVETENNFEIFHNFQFMNLWVKSDLICN
jgi:hypothetical protein